MNPADIESRFAFHPATTVERQTLHQDIRDRCKRLAHWFNDELPDGREKSLVITTLEEVMFWANAAIARQPEE